MRYIDICVQSLLLLLTLLAGASDLVSQTDEHENLYLLLMALGFWQYISCLITHYRTDFSYKAHSMYLWLGSVFALSLPIMLFVFGSSIEEHNTIKLLLTILPALSLAIFYYMTTWKLVLLESRKKGRFLPHLGF